jgi:hypothetical protein
VVCEPVQITPALDSKHARRALISGQGPQRFDAAQKTRNVSVVFIRRLVQINHLRPTTAKYRGKIGRDARVTGFFYIRARMRELQLKVIRSERGRRPLLFAADKLHFGVGHVRKLPSARRTRAVGHNHASEKPIATPKTIRHRRIRVDLDVVLVSDHTQMRGSRERLHRITAIRQKHISFGSGKFHG